MAIFVNSWPAGIALSLLTLSLVGTAFGVGAVHLAVGFFIALGLALFAIAYRAPAKVQFLWLRHHRGSIEPP